MIKDYSKNSQCPICDGMFNYRGLANHMVACKRRAKLVDWDFHHCNLSDEAGNCNHPKQEGEGFCCSYECPLGSEADLSELKKLDKRLYQEHKQNYSKEQLKNEQYCCPAADYGSKWFILY